MITDNKVQVLGYNYYYYIIIIISSYYYHAITFVQL